MTVPVRIALVALLTVASAAGDDPASDSGDQGVLQIPDVWEYSAPLIAPEDRVLQRSHAQKDPTVVFHDGRWHVFMTVKLEQRSAVEYCSFSNWKEAQDATRTILPVSRSDYFCAPQVFYFTPHRKWYLIYQVGIPGQRKMWVACSTTTDIADPSSWTAAKPILDGGRKDPRTVGGLDYWIICDNDRAWLFFTSLNGKMWRMWTERDAFPEGFSHCELALEADIFEAAHIYQLGESGRYLTLIEENSPRRYYKAYIADRLDGNWTPLTDSEDRPFAGWTNVRPADDVTAWTDNISHGELIRASNDEYLRIDPTNLQFVFQGVLDAQKQQQKYSQFPWQIGILKPAEAPDSSE